jgi:hypothetical protein
MAEDYIYRLREHVEKLEERGGRVRGVVGEIEVMEVEVEEVAGMVARVEEEILESEKVSTERRECVCVCVSLCVCVCTWGWRILVCFATGSSPQVSLPLPHSLTHTHTHTHTHIHTGKRQGLGTLPAALGPVGGSKGRGEGRNCLCWNRHRLGPCGDDMERDGKSRCLPPLLALSSRPLVRPGKVCPCGCLS